MKAFNKNFPNLLNKDDNFDSLFKKLANHGVGIEAIAEGVSSQSWTPEMVCDAISQIETEQASVDLRTVQRWFQSNGSRVSMNNLRRLAIIFGGGEDEAVSKLKVALIAANAKTLEQRRSMDKKEKQNTDSHGYQSTPSRRPILVEWLVGQFGFQKIVNNLVIYWMIYVGLGLMNFALGTFSVSYSTAFGVEKQVGFIWAPTLTILPILIIPLHMIAVSDLVQHLRKHSMALEPHIDAHSRSGSAKLGTVLRSYNTSFWAALVFCVMFVFGFQWVCIYVPVYITGDLGDLQVDRYVVALLRPDVISVWPSVFLSGFGYMYTASYIFLFMIGLLFMVIVAVEFSRETASDGNSRARVLDGSSIAYSKMMLWCSFRIAVYSFWIAIILKLQVAYLSSDAANFPKWLKIDAMTALRLTDDRNGMLGTVAISHFTTFVMVAVITLTFGYCMKVLVAKLTIPVLVPAIKMGFLVTLLISSYLMVGHVDGFSLAVALSFAASCALLRYRSLWGFEG